MPLFGIQGDKSAQRYNAWNVGSTPDGVDPAQWNANPYATFDYRHSWFQKFLETLGFRSKFDEYKDSMALNAQEYASQLQEKAHNEQYESPLEQNQRLREAGINPDLAGVTDAGSASSMEPDPNAPVSPGNDVDELMRFGSVVMDGVSALFGLVQSGADIRGKMLDNDSKFIQNSLQVLLGVSFADDPNQMEYSDGSHNIWQFGNARTERIQRLLGARHGRKYQNAVNLLVQSLSGQEAEFEHRTKRAQNRSDYYGIYGSAFYSEFHDVMDIVRGALSDLAQTEVLSKQNRNITENEYSRNYTEALDPAQMAGMDVSIKGSEVSQEGSQARIMSAREHAKTSLDEIISKLDKRAKEGSWVAELGSIIMSFLSVKYFAL